MNYKELVVYLKEVTTSFREWLVEWKFPLFRVFKDKPKGDIANKNWEDEEV